MTSVDFLKKIVGSKFLLALSASAACWQTAVVAENRNNSLTLLVFVFFATLAAYNVRVMRIVLTKLTLNTLLINRNKAKEIIWVTSTLSCVVLFFFFQYQTKLFLVIASFAALLYIMPFYSGNHRIKGIRNIYLLKNIWLAITWSLVTVMLPLSEFGLSLFTTSHILIFVSRFFFIYSIALLFDVRDAKHDARKQVYTLATQNGIVFTKVVALISAFSYCILLVIRIHSTPSLTFLLPVFYFSACFIMTLILAANPGQNFWFYEVILDGFLLLQAIITWLIHTI